MEGKLYRSMEVFLVGSKIQSQSLSGWSGAVKPTPKNLLEGTAPERAETYFVPNKAWTTLRFLQVTVHVYCYRERRSTT
jgi:hypothetical protein